MIFLYSKLDIQNKGEGLGSLQDFVEEPIVTWNASGFLEVEFKYFLYGDLTEYMIPDAKLKTRIHSNDEVYHLFTIYEVEPDYIENTIQVRAEMTLLHELKDRVVPAGTMRGTANEMIMFVKNQMDRDYPFVITGNADKTVFIEYDNISAYELIFGEDGILKRTGAEIEFTDRGIRVSNRIGTIHRDELRESDFVTNLTVNESQGEDFVTRIIPFTTAMFDRPVRDGDRYTRETIETPTYGTPVVSPNITNKLYKVRTKFVEYRNESTEVPKYYNYQTDRGTETLEMSQYIYEDVTALNQDASTFFEDNQGVDEPTTTISIETLGLAKGYYTYLRYLNRYDIVTIYVEPKPYLTNNSETYVVQVNETVYEPLSDNLVSIGFTNDSMSLRDAYRNVNEGRISGQKLQAELQRERLRDIEDRLVNYVYNHDGFRLEFGNVLPEPDEYREGDLYYLETGEGIDIYKLVNGAWEFLVGQSTREIIEGKIAEVEQQAEDLTLAIEASDQKADEAKEAAGLAKSAVDAFGIIVQENSDKMVDVEQIVADAESNASEALSQAGHATTNAQTAMSNAQSALSKASDAESTVSTLSKEVDTVVGKVALKAEQTEVDTISGTVSTHTTELEQHATAIASKAEQSEVDTVKGTVSTHTSTLEQHATAISARLTESQVDNLVSDKGYSTVSYVDNQMSVTAEGIRNEMTAVEGKIPQSYTEENLVLNSKEYVSNNDYMIKEYNLAKELTVGKEYTIVLEGGIGSTGSDQEFGIYFDNAGSYQGSLVNIAGAIYKKTFTLLQTGPNSGDKSKFMLFNLPQRGAPAVINWIKLVEGSVTDNTHTPSMSDLLLQNDFTVFKNTTENTIKAINNELSETAKKTDLNGMVTETTLATKNFITAGSVNTLLTSYAKTGDVPTATQFNSLKNRYDSMEQTIGTTNDSVARAVMTSNLWETEVSKVIDSELEQEHKTVTSKVNVVDGGKDSKYGESYPGGRYFYFNNDDGVVQRVLSTNTTYNLEFNMQPGDNKGTTVILQVKHYGTTSWVTLHTTRTTAGKEVNTFAFKNTVFATSVVDYRLAIHNVDGYAVPYIWGFRVYEEVDVEVPTTSSETGAIGSKITQLYDMINLSVLGKEGAMSRIAMGEEGIQIDGKLLHITAKTFIDDAVIKSAMIDTLDAGKITTGELNASLIRVVNLDANSITGNEASFISALFSGTKSTLQITGSGVRVLDNLGRSSTYLDSTGIEISRAGVNLGKMQYVTNVSETGDLKNMNGIVMRPNRGSYFAVSYLPTAGTTESVRRFAVSGRTGNVYIQGLIKPSEQHSYGINVTWGTITGGSTNVEIWNHNKTGGIHIANGDLHYISNGKWRSLNGAIK